MSLGYLDANLRQLLAGNGTENTFSVQGAVSTALLLGGGTETYPVTTAQSSKNFLEFRTKATAANDGSRQYYGRHHLAGASAQGETIRAFTTVDAAGAIGVRGAHISLSFGTSGTVSGEAMAIKGTLHVKDAVLGGTVSGIAAEANADGTSSDVSNGALFRGIISGNATGVGTLDDHLAVIALDGVTIGDGNIVHTSSNTATHGIRVKINGAEYELLAKAL